LDACASGPPILQDGAPIVFTWLVWPDAAETVLVLVNRSGEAPVQLGSVLLTELDELPPAPSSVEPHKRDARAIGLYLSGPHALAPYGGEPDPQDSLSIAHNLAAYMRHCGASAVILPEELADRSVRRALDGQAAEDSTGPDRLETVRRVLDRQGHSLWLELNFDEPGSLPDLPTPDSAQAVARGLVRLDRFGRPEGPAYHALHPEVRESMKRRITQALARRKSNQVNAGRVAETAPGLLIRLGPGPTLLGTPDTGLDDATFERFVLETFSPDTVRSVPGMDKADSDRFEIRARYVAGVGRMPWLTWRARVLAALYSDLVQAAQDSVPGTTLAVVTPDLNSGPAGTEARRIDRAGLAPSQAWRSVGLDLECWPSGPRAPLVLRGVSISTDALAHDLAASPDLDGLVALRPNKGTLLSLDGEPGIPLRMRGTHRPLSTGLPSTAHSLSDPIVSGRAGWDQQARVGTAGRHPTWLTAMPLGTGIIADEPLGHSLAALDARWIFVAGKAAAGHEERIRRFAAVLRALPAWPATTMATQGDSNPKAFGIAVRSMGDDAQTFLEIANDSPYPIRLATVLAAPSSAIVDDLGRGLRLLPPPEGDGRLLVLDLIPFGVSAIRVGAPRVHPTSVRPFPSEAVLASMQARFNELTAQLSRLNRGISAIPAEPLNAGFEPNPRPDLSSSVQPSALTPDTRPKEDNDSMITVAGGWHLEGDKAGKSALTIDRENPHAGEGSLRLSSPERPASAASEPFLPNVQSSLTLQVFLRASAADTIVRVWIEGESAGEPYVRRTELSVSNDWDEFAVRAADLPVGGLDSVRVRFELVAPGTLWVDDLRIESESAVRSARLNAQRTLLAALQAYREQRYTDFARLAGSHWIRESSAVSLSRLARRTDTSPSAGARTNRSAEGAPSALPPDRKLR
jgi:hypothetical protein